MEEVTDLRMENEELMASSEEARQANTKCMEQITDLTKQNEELLTSRDEIRRENVKAKKI